MIQDRICKQCGCHFNGSPRAYYCHDCRYERSKELHKIYNQRQKLGTTRKLGSIDICERCKNEYTVVGGLQKFCPKCQKEHALEHDRITGLKYYHANKDKINPIRNIRRRIALVTCRWCENKFDANHTCRVCCSAECSRKYRNKMWMEKAYPKRLKKKEVSNNNEIKRY